MYKSQNESNWQIRGSAETENDLNTCKFTTNKSLWFQFDQAKSHNMKLKIRIKFFFLKKKIKIQENNFCSNLSSNTRIKESLMIVCYESGKAAYFLIVSSFDTSI